PFFPAVAARVKDDFAWRGLPFPAGRRVLLDLYGTNHDPRSWDDPQRFDPDRFLRREPTDFDFVPQGGGRAADNHRCPGEGVAMAVMGIVTDFLATELDYTLAPGSGEIDMRRLPALPRGGLPIIVRRGP